MAFSYKLGFYYFICARGRINRRILIFDIKTCMLIIIFLLEIDIDVYLKGINCKLISHIICLASI